jgi:hypothetical protein
MGYETISFDTTKGYFQDIRESNPELFNYGSQRLKDTFGITNPNFEEIEVTEENIVNDTSTQQPTIEETKEERKIKVEQFNITIKSDNKMYFENGQKVTDQTTINKVNIRKELQDGTLRVS